MPPLQAAGGARTRREGTTRERRARRCRAAGLGAWAHILRASAIESGIARGSRSRCDTVHSFPQKIFDMPSKKETGFAKVRR